MRANIKLLKGDITKLAVDAIVNAANASLLGGGGVDGAIHAAAGPELRAECKTLNGINTGEAKITKGYKLLAKFVIHTLGPIWHGGDKNEDNLLALCYKNCLKIAEEKKIKSIAFPNISTGVYSFPKQRAADIAMNVLTEFINKKPNSSLVDIYIVCFDQENYKIYSQKKGIQIISKI